MKRSALSWIVITIFLASCNLVTPESVAPPSPHATTGPFSPTISTISPPAEETGVRIAGHVALNDGTGLANVSIYLSLAAYSGERIALTDEDGNFQSGLKFIPGDENVTVWAELEGYTFNPSNYHWRHYHGLEERTLNFSAAASTPISSAQTISASNEVLPAWVGTPAKGDPPRSELPLPEGVCNGDIVIGQDNLLWFIWENTKSRVWFPGQLSEDDLSSLPDGLDTNRHLRGSTQPDSALGYLAITDKGNIFWIDPMKGNKYPLNLITVSRDDLNVIPTAYGEQCYPAFK